MKIEHLQALRIKIRGELAGFYSDLAYSKMYRKFYDEDGETEEEYRHHNIVNTTKAEIKKLVAIQCDIKADIKKEIALQRQERKCALMKQSVMANCGELY